MMGGINSDIAEARRAAAMMGYVRNTGNYDSNTGTGLNGPAGLPPIGRRGGLPPI